MLEKIHISYYPGTRGDFLTCAIMTCLYDDTDYYITDGGRLILKDQRVNRKTLDFKLQEVHYKQQHSYNKENIIGTSHQVTKMRKYVSNKPIIISFDFTDIDQIILQYEGKNIWAKTDKTKQLEKYSFIKRMSSNKNLSHILFVKYKDITQNLNNIIEQISKHVGIKLSPNEKTDKLLKEYIQKNNQYERK